MNIIPRVRWVRFLTESVGRKEKELCGILYLFHLCTSLFREKRKDLSQICVVDRLHVPTLREYQQYYVNGQYEYFKMSYFQRFYIVTVVR